MQEKLQPSRLNWIILVVISSVVAGIAAGVIMCFGGILVSLCIAFLSDRVEIAWIGIFVFAFGLAPLGFLLGVAGSAVYLVHCGRHPAREMVQFMAKCILAAVVPVIAVELLDMLV